MLSIGKMVARSGEYYIATVAEGREAYYTGSGVLVSGWGRGARRLGLEGTVRPGRPSPGARRHLTQRRDPDGREGGRRRKRVASFDLTWSAPK